FFFFLFLTCYTRTMPNKHKGLTLSPFILFSKDMQPEIQKFSNVLPKDRTKVLGRMWRDLSFAEKAYYQDKIEKLQNIIIKAGEIGVAQAEKSNEVLVKVMREALAKTSISPDVIQLIPSNDRDTTRALLNARGKVDLVIPRGSAALIRMVVDESTVPTIETGAGVCHVYVDEKADLNKALPILINSKCHRPSVCNAAETLLVHQDVAAAFLPEALKALHGAGVVLHCDEASLQVAQSLKIPATLVQEENWSTEYGVLEINVGVVPNLISAADHILKYGTNHTEAIVTESQENADAFIALSDCAAVMVNASTRFTDGEQMGFGAEIGISNQKLHARGPMGLEQMTTTTWIVRGNGQIRK
ncbi:MAG: hypothetical protein RL733_867, partial [Actinomycetota bacterium]